MTHTDQKIRWAPRVSQSKIRRLYETDAQGIIDEGQIDDVGWALWSRCDSILTVTAAHNGHVRCPACDTSIERQNTRETDEQVTCPACGWSMAWEVYHRSYRGKQLFGANAVDAFQVYHQAFPLAQTARAKMLLIDQLIHAFHISLQTVGRPAAANLIEGSLLDIIGFLDGLTSAGTSAAGIGDAREAWHSTLAAAEWYTSLTGTDSEP
ncbi:MAG: hypothetical protein JXB07_17505 [Anaerolineae bacterium]|nr:hypothetical protein [Anaerolineae bacterium]